jgi:hypothetical protein
VKRAVKVDPKRRKGRLTRARARDGLGGKKKCVENLSGNRFGKRLFGGALKT